MSNFFSERGYPDNILSKAFNRVQNVNRESALEPSASDNEERIPFTLTFHPNNLAARNAVLRNFKILQSDPETAPIFPNPPLVSFKRDRNLRNSLVRSSLPSNLEPGTFDCSRKVCNTCPFINSKTHIRGPNGSYQVNDHFDCTTSNIIYCITCTLCNLYSRWLCPRWVNVCGWLIIRVGVVLRRTVVGCVPGESMFVLGWSSGSV